MAKKQYSSGFKAKRLLAALKNERVNAETEALMLSSLYHRSSVYYKPRTSSKRTRFMTLFHA